MTQARSKRLFFGLLTSAMVLASVGQINAEMIYFANGRTLTVKDYRIAGDSITVTLLNGGEATFERAMVTQIAPDEVPPAEESAVAVAEPGPASGQSRLPLEARPFADVIETVSLKHGIDPALVHAVVEAESNYRPAARSHMGARGLMQVMPATAREVGVRSATSLFDPQANIEAGVRYLKSLLERFDGNLSKALAAYNAGPAAVLKYGGVPPFRETQAYVRKVLSLFHQ